MCCFYLATNSGGAEKRDEKKFEYYAHGFVFCEFLFFVLLIGVASSRYLYPAADVAGLAIYGLFKRDLSQLHRPPPLYAVYYL